ncbi:macrophage infectivity potentiator protein [Streptococcus pneumoniae]|nr:macrophage infectivity potentiator protein [Streptococcus pneumoniae]
MTTFTIHTVESAPAEVKEILETVEKDNNGYIPNLIGLLANAPTVLEAYQNCLIYPPSQQPDTR